MIHCYRYVVFCETMNSSNFLPKFFFPEMMPLLCSNCAYTDFYCFVCGPAYWLEHCLQLKQVHINPSPGGVCSIVTLEHPGPTVWAYAAHT